MTEIKISAFSFSQITRDLVIRFGRIWTCFKAENLLQLSVNFGEDWSDSRRTIRVQRSLRQIGFLGFQLKSLSKLIILLWWRLCNEGN